MSEREESAMAIRSSSETAERTSTGCRAMLGAVLLCVGWTCLPACSTSVEKKPPPVCNAPPMVLVSDSRIYGLQVASDDAHVYFTESDSSPGGEVSLWAVAPTQGAKPTELWHEPNVLFGRGMAVDESAVYWPAVASDGQLGVLGVRKTDGALVVDRGIDGTGMSIALEADDDGLYASTLMGIVRVPKAGGNVAVVTSDHSIPIAVAGGSVFYASGDAGNSISLERVPSTGGNSTKLAVLSGIPSAISVSGDSVFFAIGATLFACPIDGGAPVALAPPFASSVEAVTSDESAVYVEANGIFKVARDGSGTTQKLADISSTATEGAIYVDDSNVVWAVPGQVGAVGKCY